MTRAEREPVSMEDTRQPDLVQRSIAAHQRAAARHTGKRRANHLTAIDRYKASIDATPSDFGRATLQAPQQTKRATRAAQRAFQDRGIKS